MLRKSLEYDRLVEKALRTVVRDALQLVAEEGLPGNHHFYITFATTHPGVTLADRLRERYPDEMTIVLQHQFSHLAVSDEGFGVTLSFSGIAEHLEIPFAAVTAFADPSVQFGLQFRRGDHEDGEDVPEESPEDDAEQFTDPPVALAPVKEGSSSRIPQSGGRKKGKSGEKAKKKFSAKEDGAEPEEKVVTLDSFRKK